MGLTVSTLCPGQRLHLRAKGSCGVVLLTVRGRRRPLIQKDHLASVEGGLDEWGAGTQTSEHRVQEAREGQV